MTEPIPAAEPGGSMPPAAQSDDAPKLTVESFNNHVYFYADVDSDRSLALIQQLNNADSMMRNMRVSQSVPESFPRVPIWLHVFSYGGSLFSGLSLADQIPQIQTPVYSIIEGCCASAATLIALSCPHRSITKGAYILIHQFYSVMWGKHEEFKDEMVLQEKLMDQLVQFYVDHSVLKKKKVQALLKHDTWLNADEALEAGLVDQIVGR